MPSLNDGCWQMRNPPNIIHDVIIGHEAVIDKIMRLNPRHRQSTRPAHMAVSGAQG